MPGFFATFTNNYYFCTLKRSMKLLRLDHNYYEINNNKNNKLIIKKHEKNYLSKQVLSLLLSHRCHANDELGGEGTDRAHRS